MKYPRTKRPALKSIDRARRTLFQNDQVDAVLHDRLRNEAFAAEFSRSKFKEQAGESARVAWKK